MCAEKKTLFKKKKITKTKIISLHFFFSCIKKNFEQWEKKMRISIYMYLVIYTFLGSNWPHMHSLAKRGAENKKIIHFLFIFPLVSKKKMCFHITVYVCALFFSTLHIHKYSSKKKEKKKHNKNSPMKE